MTKEEKQKYFESKLVVGTKIRIGKKFSEGVLGRNFLKENDIITLVEGEFEVENGLYTEIQKCPAIWDPELKEYDSIYHLFDNNFDNWLDCEIINNLPWSEISCPIDGVSYYDHITCNTSLGLLKIEWKSWKTNSSYDLFINDKWIGAEYEIENAKDLALKFLIDTRNDLNKLLGT